MWHHVAPATQIQELKMAMRRSVALCRWAVIYSVALASSALAQGQPNALKCSFESGYFTVFEGNVFKSESGGDMAFVIASINLDAGTAQIVANAGASDLILLPGRENMNFIEQTAAGNLNLTTVYTGTASDGRFLAVHSRHVGHATDPMLSQYYGLCEGLW
jgi:hypothetical protein